MIFRGRIEAGGSCELGVVEVFVQVRRRDRGSGEYGDAGFGQVSLHGGPGEGSGTFEADIVDRVGVGDVDLAGYGVRRHVEKGRADVREGGDRFESVRVEGEDVRVGQIEADGAVPDTIQFVHPVAVQELDDQAYFGGGLAGRVGGRAGIASGTGRAVGKGTGFVLESGADAALIDGGGLVAGFESCHVDGGAIGTDGQGSRGVGKEAQDGQGRSAGGGSEIRGIEDPDVGTRISGNGHLRVACAGDVRERGIRALLAAMRGGDEGARRRSGEDDIARFIAD